MAHRACLNHATMEGKTRNMPPKSRSFFAFFFGTKFFDCPVARNPGVCYEIFGG
jgi:hypothetical protein